MTTQTLTGATRQRPLWPFTLVRNHAAPAPACSISASLINPDELRRLVAAMVD